MAERPWEFGSSLSAVLRRLAKMVFPCPREQVRELGLA
jgi:hypothetical protein